MEENMVHGEVGILHIIKDSHNISCICIGFKGSNKHTNDGEYNTG